MTAAWKFKRPLSYGLLGAALFCLYAYTRDQIKLSDLMVSEQVAFEKAWREGYRLSPQDFRVRVQADSFAALSRLTNSPLSGSPWPLPETIWWLRSTFLESVGDPENPPVPWSEIEAALNETGPRGSQEVLQILTTTRVFQFPASRIGSRRLAYLGPLTQVDRYLLMELGLLLHQNRRDEAWLHLLGLTRLATGYKPDPMGVAQMTRYQFMQAALTALWSFSRCFPLTQPELEELLTAWREVDVLGGMPDTAAFTRCEFLPLLNQERLPQGFSRSWQAFFLIFQKSSEDLREQWVYFKDSTFSDVRAWFDRHEVLYLDGLHLIQQSCQRERELKRAIQLESWPEMRRQLDTFPGPWPPFTPSTRAAVIVTLSRFSTQIWIRTLPSDIQDYEWVPYVEAESLRRLALAGLMLRLHVAQTGTSPAEGRVMGAIPLDFRTGAPFLYRRIGLRDFELRSPGATNAPTPLFDPESIYPRIPRKTPLVWPSQTVSP